MKTKLTLLFILFSFFTLAQETIKPKEDNNYKSLIGLGAGFTTGFGFSYRYVPDKSGIQINLAPYYNRDGNSFVSAGITFLQTLKVANDHKLLFYFSNSVFYKKDYYAGYWNYSYNNYYGTPYQTYYTAAHSDVTTSFNTGAGLDLQFYTGSPFVFDLMGGIGSYDSFSRVTFTGEFAIYYKL